MKGKKKHTLVWETLAGRDEQFVIAGVRVIARRCPKQIRRVREKKSLRNHLKKKAKINQPEIYTDAQNHTSILTVNKDKRFQDF